jgi:DNA-binding NarL/FixJ family response regulator
MGLVRQGKSNKEIAWLLCLECGTVKEYLFHIFRKTGVTNRVELAIQSMPGQLMWAAWW